MSIIFLDFNAVSSLPPRMSTTKRGPRLITPNEVRFIKLGPGNTWFRSCLEKKRLALGHHQVSHGIALTLNRERIAADYAKQGRTPAKAKDFAREIADFYSLGEDCLWITFAEGCLWWAFARAEVTPVTSKDGSEPARYRRLITGWSNKDVLGNRLNEIDLSSALTKVAAYRQTLCKVEAAQYLIRKINGVEEPIVAEANQLIENLCNVADAIIAKLHWRDFEILCDLIFSNSGWRRITELGGHQKDVDLVLGQAASGERAFVQIKSSATKNVFDQYVSKFADDNSFHRMFFCCHSPATRLNADCSKPVHVWAGSEIAKQAISAGLFEWLTRKAN